MPELIPRVVIDCNLFVKESPTVTAQRARRCGCFQWRHIALVSEPIIREVRDVLNRAKLRRKLAGIKDRIVNAFLTKLEAKAIPLANVPRRVSLRTRPDDDRDVCQSCLVADLQKFC
jgi:hypothetical protein